MATGLVPRFQPEAIDRLVDAAVSTTALPLLVIVTCLSRRPVHHTMLALTHIPCDVRSSGEVMHAAAAVMPDFRGAIDFVHADESEFPVIEMQLGHLPAAVILSTTSSHVVARTSSPANGPLWEPTLREALARFQAGSLTAHVRSSPMREQPAWSLQPRKTTSATFERDIGSSACSLLLVHDSQAGDRNGSESLVARWQALTVQLASAGSTACLVLTLDLASDDIPQSPTGERLRQLVSTEALPAFVASQARDGVSGAHEGGDVSLYAVPARRVRSDAALRQWASSHVQRCAPEARPPRVDGSSSARAEAHAQPDHGWLEAFVQDGVALLQDGLRATHRRRLDARVQLYASDLIATREWARQQDALTREGKRASRPQEAVAAAAAAEWLQESEWQAKQLIRAAVSPRTSPVAQREVHDPRALAEETERRMSQLHAAGIQMRAAQQRRSELPRASANRV